MSAATIKRGNASGRRPKARGKAPGRALKRVSRFDKVLALLPVSEATLQRMATWTMLALLGGAAYGTATFMGLPAMAQQEFAEVTARAGFEVAKVEVHGVERMDEMDVYQIALGEVDQSMATLDLAGLRTRLLTLGWVKDARVSRRLPDTLVVDIVERQPKAVWQHSGNLRLIDENGAVLESVSADAMPDLPLVIGPNANMQTHDLNTLLDSAPALKPMLAGATWVGNRRWDLRFQSGETLSLPQGSTESAAALVTFARMDGVNRLLGRGIVRFDMRDPDKFILRKADGKAATNAEATTSEPTTKAAPKAEEG